MMKKLLYLFMLIPVLGISQTNVYSYGFEGVTADLTTAGWLRTNQSAPATAVLWGIPTAQPSTTFAGGAQAGAVTSFALVNFTSVGVLTTTGSTGSGTISNWLISPLVNVKNGDIISFYTRIGRNSTTGLASFADNLEMRLSTNGDFTVNPTNGATDLGDFTTLCVAVNPNQDLLSYPLVWTRLSYTVVGIPTETPCKVAFRYFVTDGGNDGANSDIIGIDTFSVDRPTASTQEFFANNFSIQPNPVNDVFNLTSNNGSAIENVKVIDINGRVVNEINVSDSESIQVNVSDLNSGVYFVKVQSELGVGTSKIVKK
jgi:hypothetical protein